jgi:CorA-like Mg2+ transporter protein
VAAQRDLLSTVLEANLAVISVEQTKVSVRQNAAVEQLTILATIFLPLTFVTGFFGQNFEWLVGHINSLAAFLIYGLGGLALPMVLLFWWLKHRKPQKDPEGMPVFTRVGLEVARQHQQGIRRHSLPRRQLRREATSGRSPSSIALLPPQARRNRVYLVTSVLRRAVVKWVHVSCWSV